METISANYVFQVDSDIVKHVYETQDNYLIEYDGNADNNTCAIYFCSNDIYFPNSEEVFRKRIVDHNFYEWYRTRIRKAHKHIFVRDVFKQWYLKGISKKINTPDKLIGFLKEQTNEHENVIALGSSAGGYAAIFYGSMIGARSVIAFNPQFEITSLLQSSSEAVNPFVFRLRETRRKYFDIIPYINANTEIFYFYSIYSKWDKKQKEHLPALPNIYPIAFKTQHHGIPFLKVALPIVLNLNTERLKTLKDKLYHPVVFTIKMVGIRKTVSGFISQLYQLYKNRR